MDIIFKIGIFLLPFENFFFAPSSGWATISPLVFVIYILLNFKMAIKGIYKYKFIFFFVLVAAIISLIDYLFYGLNFENIISTLISIGLGLICLLSFYIFLNKEKNNLDDLVPILISAYGISLCIGWIQFIVINFNLSSLINLISRFEKRSYILHGRVQFTFTEPSFIGMHLYGVLLPIYYYTKDKRLKRLIIIFSISSILVNSGVKVMLDIFVVIILIFLSKVNFKKIKNLLALIFIPIIAFYSVEYMAQNNYRIQQILDKGIYADGSLASRYFRINASLHGYAEDGRGFIMGYGIGNSLIPLRQGYIPAVLEYDNSYMKEVLELGDANYNSDSVSYCLYIRIISELGIISLFIVVGYLYYLTRKNKTEFNTLYFIVILYLYLQFESYAFYAVWIYIILKTNNICMRNNNELLKNTVLDNFVDK